MIDAILLGVLALCGVAIVSSIAVISISLAYWAVITVLDEIKGDDGK